MQNKIEHIILLTGEVKDLSTLEYIKQGVSILKNIFLRFCGSYASGDGRICRIKEIGLDGMTIYQETYDEKVYDKVHLYGKKKNYQFRLGTPERAAKAGLRTIGIGALFGLSDIRKEAFLRAFIYNI